MGDGTLPTGEEVASLLKVVGAAGTQRRDGAPPPGAPLRSAQLRDVGVTDRRLERAVVRMANNDVAAWPTRWYRIFPSLLSDASSSLREMLPPQIATTPLDDALHEWVRGWIR